jgi:hypothetical protein
MSQLETIKQLRIQLYCKLFPRPRNRIDIEIIPKKGASPQQLKGLAEAIERWQGDMLEDWCSFVGGGLGLDDLRKGELPQPFAVLAPAAIKKVSKRLYRELKVPRMRNLAQDEREYLTRRTVSFRLKYHKERCNRQLVLDTLRDAIPADLVDDVLLNDQSWT